MNRITVDEFMELPHHEQYEVLSHNGNLVECREEGLTRYELYAVDRIFVEVAYNLQGDQMFAMKAFNTGRQLDKYSPELQTILTGILRH